MGLMMLDSNTNGRAIGTRPHETVMAIEKLERYKSSGIDKIPAELIKARGRAIHSETHKHINSILKKEELH